jgi:uroporphyrinogen decarboxylase
MVYDDPSLIHEVNDAYVTWILSVAQLAYDTGGIDGFILADDWGGTQALLMSPEHLREFFIPPFKRIVQGLKKFGLPVLMHNDGNLWKVMDDLVATGIDGYHPVERAASMDLGRIKEQYKGKLCPVGNINNKTTMVNGTPEDVTREALECLKIGAPGGGYILATDHSIHDDIPNENVYAYIEAARKYGTYPLQF